MIPKLELTNLTFLCKNVIVNIGNIKKVSEEKAINDIVKELKSRNSTFNLINKLEIVIDDDENYLVQIILMYDKCNNNIEILKNKVDKRYKNNQKFHKKDYFNLFLKYNDLFNKLKYHYDNNV